MKARTPDKALPDMRINLSHRSMINAAFAGFQMFNPKEIKGYIPGADFDFFGFIFSEDFRPDIHLQKNQKRIWPVIEKSFQPEELNKFHFNQETCGSKMDKDIVRRAIILCAVIDGLEGEYFKAEMNDQMSKNPGMSSDEFRKLQSDCEVKCRPITAGKVFSGQLDILMRYVYYLEKLELLTVPITQKIARSNQMALKYFAAEIVANLFSCARVLGMAGMESILKILKNYVDNPTAENAQHCAEKARQLFMLPGYEQHKRLMAVIEKLVLIDIDAKADIKKQRLDVEAKLSPSKPGLFGVGKAEAHDNDEILSQDQVRKGIKRSDIKR